MPKNHGFIPQEVEHRQNLNGVMYALYHLQSLDEARTNSYMYNTYDEFVNIFSPQRQQETIDSIRWALGRDDIDDCFTLPNLPRDSEFKRDFLVIVLGHLEAAIK